jgi:hypothetical protein
MVVCTCIDWKWDQEPEGVVSQHVELYYTLGTSQGYTVLFIPNSSSGVFNRIGDGGYINWAFYGECAQQSVGSGACGARVGGCRCVRQHMGMPMPAVPLGGGQGECQLWKWSLLQASAV